jgi:predicted small metal-binding protein
MSFRNGDKAQYGKQRKKKIQRREHMRQVMASLAGNQAQAPTGHLSYACRDAGQADCDWQASADTKSELMKKVREHARKEHNLPTVSARQRADIQKSFKAA